MPRKPADPSARLTLLLAGQKQIKPGDVLSKADMAKALGMTERNLTLTIISDPDFPVMSRGGEGVAWQLDAAAVFGHLISICNATLAERETRAARMQRLSGYQPPAPVAGLPATDDGPLSIQDLKQLGDAQMTVHRLKEAQKHFMPREAVMNWLMNYHSKFQSNALALLSKVDPAGQWPADVRRVVEDALRTILLEQQDDMTRFAAAHRVTTAP